MKELSIVEKAKRYDEAIEIARQIHDADRVSGIELTTCEEIFPELKESEDERIRKDLLGYLHTLPNHFSHNGSLVTEWLAWLEKQDEQKPAWSEEDKEYINDLTAYFDGCSLQHVTSDIILWLKSLKERVQPQPKQEWSYEDESFRIQCLDLITHFPSPTGKIDWTGCQNWLKSLRPQNTWKPSEEQMEALSYYLKNDIIDNDGVFGSQLVKLYQDLLKLKL